MAKRSKRSKSNRERMSLKGHFIELRNRVALIAVGLLVGTIIGWNFYQPLFSALQQPLLAAGERHGVPVNVNFDVVMAPFDLQLRGAFFLGIILSLPWWLYQIWAFITPGLSRKERRYAIAFIAAGIPLFLSGVALAWFVLPNAVDFLLRFIPEDTSGLISAMDYITLVMQLILVFGFVFLLPLILTALNMAGILRGRTMLDQWRWAVVVATVTSAMATPTADMFTMFFVALPIIGLYYAAAGLAVMRDKRVNKKRVAAGLPPLGVKYHYDDDGNVIGESS